jgi:hypothetical protein
MDSRLRGNDIEVMRTVESTIFAPKIRSKRGGVMRWIPAFAGMTSK